MKIMSIRIAQNLMKLDYKQNDVFAFIARKNSRVTPVMCGIILMGGVINPLDYTLPDGELFHKHKYS